MILDGNPTIIRALESDIERSSARFSRQAAPSYENFFVVRPRRNVMHFAIVAIETVVFR
jgi:hypothetical protein